MRDRGRCHPRAPPACSYAGLPPTRASQLMQRLLAASLSSALSLASADLSSREAAIAPNTQGAKQTGWQHNELHHLIGCILASPARHLVGQKKEGQGVSERRALQAAFVLHRHCTRPSGSLGWPIEAGRSAHCSNHHQPSQHVGCRGAARLRPSPRRPAAPRPGRVRHGCSRTQHHRQALHGVALCHCRRRDGQLCPRQGAGRQGPGKHLHRVQRHFCPRIA